MIYWDKAKLAFLAESAVLLAAASLSTGVQPPDRLWQKLIPVLLA
jgi:hypothetical protein